MMGNVTVDIYQELRTHHRTATGGDYFPGTVDDYTMYIDEFELVFMFKDGSTRPSIVHGNSFGSHIGYPSFTVLNGIDRSKFWLYANLDLIGVTKSHTRLNDRGNGKFTQTAAFKAGSCSVIHNGTDSITANTEFKVAFYDAVHDPEKFYDLFQASHKLDAGRVRILGVIEPYEKHDDIATMLRYYHPHKNIGPAGRDAGHDRLTFGRDRSEAQFTIAAIIERIIDGSGGLLILGFLLGSFVSDEPLRINGSAPDSRANFKRYLRSGGQTTASVKKLIDVVHAQGSDDASGIGEFVAGMIFPQTAADNLLNKKEIPRRRSLLSVAVAAQKEANYLYPALKELITWERKWVVGLAQQTTHPNGVMDIIIRR